MIGKKPLGMKAYGSIAHLPNSRMGPGDHSCHDGQARIVTEKVRDRHDRVIVQEKLDGSCCSVARLDDGSIVALTRSGLLAWRSRFSHHVVFAWWAHRNAHRFDGLLPGQRIVGEWLALAHGTLYEVPTEREAFVAFDLIERQTRKPFDEFNEFARTAGLATPFVVSDGPAVSVDDALLALGEFGRHGAQETVEGVVYRVERRGVVDFLAKWVRPDKTDGKYLHEVSKSEPVWNWSPVDQVWRAGGR